MNYEELNNLWKNQREQYKLWENELLQHARSLRDHFEEKLNFPHKSWLEHGTNKERLYVELVDFFNKNKPERKRLDSSSITPEGSLVFGVGITFDHGLESYPKEGMFIPIAIRYKDKSLEYSIFDIEPSGSFGDWTKDKDALYLTATKMIHEYLSHDPYDGFDQPKRAIGFVA